MTSTSTQFRGFAQNYLLPAICLGFAFIFDCLGLQAQQQNTYSLIRIPIATSPDIQALQNMGLDDDHGIHKNGTYYESIVSKHALSQLTKNAIPYQEIHSDMESFYESRLKSEYPAFIKQLQTESKLAPKNFVTGSMGGYYTLEEIYKEMSRLVQYSQGYFISLDTIGITHENRPIIAWTFGSRQDLKKPATLLTALHHSREPGGVTTLLYFLWDLLERANEGDQEAKYLLTERTLVIVPCLNPDGYAFNQSQKPEGGGLWRKNRRIIDAKTFGVDLNRNYGPESFWNANNGGSSTDPNSDLYRGTAPFSEPETKAMQSLCGKYAFGCIFNYHTYSNLLIYPFAALSRETEDSSTFRGFAADATRFNAYSAGRDLETVGYTTRGNSDDWAYHEHNALAFTPEVGAITDGFWPSPTRILPHARENLHMNYQALWSSGSNLCIRLAENNIDTISMNDASIGSLIIDVQNIGRLDLKEKGTIRISSLRDDVIVIDSVINIDSVYSGERLSHNIQFRVQKNYRNGDPARFLISRVQHGISRIDTAVIILYRPTVYDLFVRESDKTSFDLDNWNMNTTASIPYLEDSPGFMYKPKIDNYAVYAKDLDLSEYRRAILQLETQWNIEPIGDFGVIQVSTDKGATWDFIRTSRMVKGSGISGAKQPSNGFGFQGNMPEWEFQKADLSGMLKPNVRFRFGMLSDDGAEFNGFAIRNVRVLAYADSFNSIDVGSEVLFKTDVHPIPANDNYLYVTIERLNHGSPLDFTVEIFDHIGRAAGDIMQFTLYEKQYMIPIPIPSLSAGIYHVRVRNNFGINQVITVPVIR